MKKRIRAIPAAAAAIPVNPKSAAMIATTNKMIAQRSIVTPFALARTSAPSRNGSSSFLAVVHAD
jgi:hypothetical protein